MAIIDELIEKAFCDGYEYAQREYANKNPNVTWKKIKEAAKKVGKKLKENAEGYETPKSDKTITLNPDQMKNFMVQRGYSFNSFMRNRFAGNTKFLRRLRDFKTESILNNNTKKPVIIKDLGKVADDNSRNIDLAKVFEHDSDARDTVKIGKKLFPKKK